MNARIAPFVDQGKTVVGVAAAGRVIGYLAIADKLRASFARSGRQAERHGNRGRDADR